MRSEPLPLIPEQCVDLVRNGGNRARNYSRVSIFLPELRSLPARFRACALALHNPDGDRRFAGPVQRSPVNSLWPASPATFPDQLAILGVGFSLQRLSPPHKVNS